MAGIFWPIWRAEGYTIELEDLSTAELKAALVRRGWTPEAVERFFSSEDDEDCPFSDPNLATTLGPAGCSSGD